jgi:hypothetical protein
MYLCIYLTIYLYISYNNLFILLYLYKSIYLYIYPSIHHLPTGKVLCMDVSRICLHLILNKLYMRKDKKYDNKGIKDKKSHNKDTKSSNISENEQILVLVWHGKSLSIYVCIYLSIYLINFIYLYNN